MIAADPDLSTKAQALLSPDRHLLPVKRYLTESIPASIRKRNVDCKIWKHRSTVGKKSAWHYRAIYWGKGSGLTS
jgi:hypothetical protein